MRLDFHLSVRLWAKWGNSYSIQFVQLTLYQQLRTGICYICQNNSKQMLRSHTSFLAEIMVPLRANIYLSTIFNSWKLKTIRRLERTFHLPLVWERWFFEVNLLIFTDGWNYCNAFIIQKLFIRKESRKLEKYAKNNFCFWFWILFDLWVCVNVGMDSLIMIMLNDNVKLNNICSSYKSYKWFSYRNFAFMFQTLIYLNATIPM